MKSREISFLRLIGFRTAFTSAVKASVFSILHMSHWSWLVSCQAWSSVWVSLWSVMLMCRLVHSGERIPIRLYLSNESGYSLDITMYKEVMDVRVGQVCCVGN